MKAFRLKILLSAMRVLLIWPLLCFLFSCSKPVDLLVKNAVIITVDSSMTQVSTMVIHHGKIIALGDSSLCEHYQPKEIIDANGLYIYPGFQDAHCHFSGYSFDLEKLNLEGSTSVEDIITRCKEFQKENKCTWLQGRQWDEHHFHSKQTPDKTLLDKAFPNLPVFLLRVDGHAALCNQKALDLAGITTSTTITGGRIGITNNQLNGMVYDKAMRQVSSIIPDENEQYAIPYFQKTEKLFFEHGITSFTDCMVENSWMHALEKAYAEKRLQIRGSYVLTSTKENVRQYLSKKVKNNTFQICGFKVFADGSLGSYGAYMLEPYTDKPERSGYMSISTDSLRLLAQQIISTHYQLYVHAIGDRANKEVLDIMAQVLPASNNKRWRVEHAQVVAPEDVSKFRSYNIIPSVQPTHATSDMHWVENRLGPARSKHAYAYKTLLKQLDWMPLGTDFPVEKINPLHTFYAAVARKNEHEEPDNGFQPENALTREEALRGITYWPAKAVFNEHLTGSLEIGKEGDFVLLPVNLLTDDLKMIRESTVLATYLHGKKVFEKH